MPDRNDQLKKDPGDRELYPKPDAGPDEQEIISPSMIKIEWPSFDLQSSEFGAEITKAYLQYMLQGALRDHVTVLSTDAKGYLAVDFGAKVGKKTVWDCWDYHGPLKVKVQTTFTDKPLDLERLPQGFPKALEACFRAGGYEETSEEMRQFEEVLGALKYSVSHKLLGFDAEPLKVPLGDGKAVSMEKTDYVKAVMEANPEVFIHWRDA